jgi:hypothetical protein
MQLSFDKFQSYLINLGYKTTTREITIFVDPKLTDNVYYDRQRIVLGEPLASDTDAFFREYTHHALVANVEFGSMTNDQQSVESGLADYFPCSFSDDPLFGEKSVHIFQNIPEFVDKKAIRNMENDLKFSQAAINPESHHVGEIWSGAFWEIRRRLGKNEADKLLFSTWMAMLPLNDRGNFNSDFISKLVHGARSLEDGDRSAEIAAVFKRREFPIVIGH